MAVFQVLSSFNDVPADLPERAIGQQEQHTITEARVHSVKAPETGPKLKIKLIIVTAEKMVNARELPVPSSVRHTV
jgi:hypothetical protein